MNFELLYNIFGVIHIITCFLLIIFVLFQKSTGDGLFASAAGGGNSFMSGMEIASFLTKATKYLGIFFLINTVFLATLSVKISVKTKVILEEDQKQERKVPSNY